MVAKSTVILSWSILLFPAIFVVTAYTLSFQRDRGQLRNAVSLGGMVAEVAVAEADAEPTDRVGSDSMVERCTESFLLFTYPLSLCIPQ